MTSHAPPKPRPARAEAFPRRLVQSELNRVRAKAKSFVPLRANG